MTPTYTPAHYASDDPQLIRQFLQQHYFGLLLTTDLQLSAIPFLFEWEQPTGLTGTVYGHLAAQNPQLQGLRDGDKVKLVVQGPHAFVAAECYQQQPQVATWNYSLVEISGTVQLLDTRHTLALVRRQQAAANRALPPQVQDELVRKVGTDPGETTARQSNLAYEKQLSSAITGFAVSIESLHAKMKLSQNKTPAARQDVLQFLQQSERPQTVWQLMQAQGLFAAETTINRQNQAPGASNGAAI
ncbi:FMN-binding negative transcriptional regulator [Rheinheimera texasensis]|uniref:FMN-binding negative transcriptional regulator n=1 Tax=Rheinheimera texasensis TaxID=306205 RepID=UPI0032B18771